MSLQPNRVLARIIDQVEKSGWDPLPFEMRIARDGREWTRFYCEPTQPRYATPVHFWVHALRDVLEYRSRGEDLAGVAGYALCRRISLKAWRAELGGDLPERVSSLVSNPISQASASGGGPTIYMMQGNECQRSSVAWLGDHLVAHFWRHGPGPNWQQKACQ